MSDGLIAVLAFGLAALCSLVTICIELFADYGVCWNPRSSAPSRRGRPAIIIIGAASGPDSGPDADGPAAFVPASGAALDELAAGNARVEGGGAVLCRV